MSEKEFWNIVRRSLLNIITAIDKRYGKEQPEQQK